MNIAPRVFPRTHAGRPYKRPEGAGLGYVQPKPLFDENATAGVDDFVSPPLSQGVVAGSTDEQSDHPD
jgi:hypothetical protein